jgi:DNA adenine methylase
MKPLISYYGGKQRLAPKLVPLIPKHTVYCEPFAGGAALLFAKPWPAVRNSDHYREVINDTCGDLVNLYRQAQEHPEALVQLIDYTPYSEAEYARSTRILRREIPADALHLAWAYYVNLRMSFGGKKYGGWGRAVCSANHAALWHSRDLWSSLERLRGVYICQQEALAFILQWDSPQTFFYCDPPYPGANQGHYAGYTHDDFGRLIETLSACQGTFVLSCYDVGMQTPTGWQRQDIPTSCAAGGKGRMRGSKRTEVVYVRPNRVSTRPEIAKLYASGAYDCFTG